MFVSRKNLSFIHFVACIGPIGSKSPPEPLHQGRVFLGFACLVGELDEPFAERLIEGPLLCPSKLTGLLYKLFVCTECNVLHTSIVYTIFVYTVHVLLLRKGGAPRKLGGGAQLFFDAQELVILGDAVGAGG